MEKRGFYEAVTTLVGTIIGAGVLAIPYAIMKAGFLTGLLNLVVLSISSFLVYSYVGEIVLRTKGSHQLPGYARKYLGKTGSVLMAFSMIFGIYGALVAYIIGVGKSFAVLFGMQNIPFTFFGFSVQFNIIFSILFFILVSSIVYLGLKMVGKAELIMSTLIILALVAISLIALPRLNISNLMSFSFSKILIPYGVILFALSGAVAVPEMKEELQKNKKLLKKAILIGVSIPVLLYFLFSLATVGVCGLQTTEIATVCLGEKFGIVIFLIGNIFAILAMSTSFMALGLALKEMYHHDYKTREKRAWVLACIVPLVLFFLVLLFLPQETFFKTISISGGVTMTLEGILIVLMHRKAKRLGERNPEYSIKANKFISALLILIFLLGMIYTFLNFFGII
jgi:amino acid permease